MDIDKKLTEFVAAKLNQFLDFDKRYGAQCYDLIQYWSQFIGGPFISGAVALDIARFQSPFYTWVENTPTNVPANGDIMVLKEPYGKYIDTDGTVKYAGHTGVVVKADVNKFTLFEQNDPTGSAAHLQEYPYTYAKGWLHLNIAPATTTQVVADTSLQDAVTACQTQLKAETETNATLRGQVASDEDLIKSLRSQKEVMQTELDDVKLKYDEENAKNRDLHEANAKISQASLNLETENHKLYSQLDQIKKVLGTFMDAFGKSYNPETAEQDLHDIAVEVLSRKDTGVDPFLQEFAQFLKDKNIDGALETLGHSPLNLNNLQDAGERQKIFAAIEGVWSFAMSKDTGATPDETAVKAVEGIATYTVKHTSFLSSLGGLFLTIFRKPSTSI